MNARKGLSSSQEYIWLDQKLNSDSSKYNIGGYVIVNSKIDSYLFEQSLQLLIDNNDVFSFDFEEYNGIPYYSAKAECKASYLEMEEECLEEAISQIEADFKLPFTLAANSPLYTIWLIRINAEQCIWYTKIHHLIGDGFSFQLIFKQVSDYYQQLKNGIDPNELEIRSLYAAFIDSDNAYRISEDFQSDREFWLAKYNLHEQPEILYSLNVSGNKSHTNIFSISKSETDAINDLALKFSVSPFHIYLGLLSVLMSKYYNSSKVSVGIPVLNRRNAMHKKTIGSFINIIPLHFKVTANTTLNDFFRSVRKEVFNCYKHQRFQYADILRGTEKTGRLYDVRLSFLSLDYKGAFADATSEIKVLSHENDDDPISIQIFSSTDGSTQIQFDINGGYVSDLEAEQLTLSYQNLLKNSTSFAEEKLSQLELCSTAQRNELLALSIGENVLRNEETFLTAWESNWISFADNSAVTDKHDRLSYAELNQKANTFANYLQKQNVQKADRIAVALPRSVNSIIAILGLFKVGAVYVPIDITYPEERKAFIAEDSACKFVIVQHAEDAIGTLPLINCNSALKVSLKTDFKSEALSENDAAYIIYTSGSTGTPKGVLINHAALYDYVCTFKSFFALSEKDKVLQQASFSFDTSIEEIFPVLLSGGALIISEQTNDFNALLKTCEYFGVSILSTNPFLIEFLNQNFTAYKLELRVLISGGDTLKPEHVDELIDQIPVYNTYGPTEATVCATYHLITKSEARIPIGKPIVNRSVFIADGINVLPKGAIGEILIGGEGVAVEYLNNSALNAERFGFIEEQRIYRSGDLGKWNENGELIFLGRKDNQLSHKGYRIEPAEIEKAIKEADAEIYSCHIEMLELEGGFVLAAYLINSERTIDLDALKRKLKKALPGHMLPDRFMQLPELPKLANGKIDKRNLPLPNTSLDSIEIDEPTNSEEKEIVEIWQNLLKQDRIGINNNFFELGGHSLLANQFVSTLRKTKGVELPLSVFFNYPTIKELVPLLKELKQTERSIEKVPTQTKYLPTESQKRLWILSQFEAGNKAYNIPLNITLKGILNKECLQKTFDYLIRRHESLRTNFYADDNGEVWQKIQAEQVVEFELGLKEQIKTLTERDQLIQLEFGKTFDLENELLIRGTLFEYEQNFQLVIVMHHIISDGWSVEVLANEIITVYNNFIEGKTPNLPDLTIQFKDYSAWFENKVSNDEFKKEETFWVNKLAGEIPVLNLPTEQTRPVIKSHNGNVLIHNFSKAFTEKLSVFCQDNEATLFMGLMAGLNGLFYRYTGQNDIVLGTPVAGRMHKDLETQIGLFLNTLAIRTQIDGKNTFKDLLKTQKEELLGAFANQNIPFSNIIEKIDIKRDPSRSALFDVMVVFQSQQNTAIKHEGDVRSLQFEVSKQTLKEVSQFDLTFSFSLVENKLSLELEFNTDIYETPFLKQLVQHFELFINDGITKANKNLNEIDFLGKEKALLLDKYIDTAIDYPFKTLINLFSEQVSKTPSGIALISGEAVLTYADLDSRSNQFAHYLEASYQLKPNDLVGVKLERNEQLIIAILGILKTGAGYVPLDPAYPAERIAYIEEESGVKVIVDSHAFQKYKSLPTQGTVFIPVQNIATDIAYVIYTSGSTGKPKGVKINYGNASSFIHWSIDEFSDAKFETVFGVTSICFDLSLFEIFHPLSFGKTLYLLENGLAIKDHLTKANNILLNTVPSVIGFLLEENTDFTNVTGINMAGEPIPPSYIAQLDIEKIEVRNLYGPSESTTYSTCSKISHANNISIGKPIANSRIYILDANTQMQAIGVVGEICISGAGLSAGYLKQAQLTADNFVANPFEKNTLMYKTGDLGKWLPSGEIAFMGRKDDQVKIRGYRIELQEIESVLESYDEIDGALVIAFNQTESQQEIVSFVVCNQTITPEKIRAKLSNELPAYMVPAYALVLECFPLMPNGKIDRMALSQLELPVEKEALTPGSTETEKVLVKLWQDVLGKQSIGIHSDFFKHGGHSLKAMRLIGAYFKAFQVKLSLKELFSNPTIALQALRIDAANKINFEIIPSVDFAINYPISDAQRRLWILSQFEEGSIAYNMPFSFELNGSYNLLNFEKAILKVIERHEILRTVFKEDEKGEIRQWIIPVDNFEFALRKEDFSNVENVQAKVAAYIQNDSNAPFDLENGPLMRATLLKLEQDKYCFYYNMHHIISDGWSLEVLGKDIWAYYNKLENKTSEEPAPLRIQYKDYSTWQLNQENSDAFQSSKNYWQNVLKNDLPLFDLPSAHKRPIVRTNQGRTLQTYLSKSQMEVLKNFTEANNGSLFMGLIAAFNALAYRYTGQEDFILGCPIAGRDHVDLEDQIGFYINTLVLRNSINETDSFETFFERVKNNTLSAYEHQQYPFDRLVEDLDLKRDTSRNAIFDVMISLQDLLEEEPRITVNDETISHVADLGAMPNKFDLDLSFESKKGALSINLNYNTALYEKAFMVQFLEHYKQLLLVLLSNTKTPIGDLDFLNDAEKKVLISDFNAKEQLKSEQNLVNRIEAEVDFKPMATAISFNGENTSYQKLNEQANQLANWLRIKYAIKSDDLIGVQLERSETLVIVLLAVLKSAGAYVPIDPALPESRIAYIKKDSGCKLVITATFLNTFKAEIKKVSTTNPMYINKSTDLAYVIYTSGSTGNPKGVMIERGSIAQKLAAESALLNLERKDFRTCLVTNYAFDVSLLEIFLPLIQGGEIIIPRDVDMSAPANFVDLLLTEKVTHLQGTPGFVQNFIVPNKGDKLADLNKGLKQICVGGESLSARLVEAIKTNLPSVKLNNHYGPTETTIDALAVSNVSQIKQDVIGEPLNDSKVYVLAKNGQVQPIGVLGEICIGGSSLARGYLNQPELTQKQFITSPFRAGERLYKTGDLGCWLDDGTIVFKGRIDAQVKVRGYRVELAEIEFHLNDLPSIDQSIVLVRKNQLDENEIIAYIRSEADLNATKINEKLKGSLPNYMVPSAYVQVDEIPYTSNGKVDNKALVEQYPILAELSSKYVAPQNETETQLVLIWQTVLEKEQISVTADFFELGGHSLKAMRLITAYHEQFNVKLTLTGLFRETSIRQHAKIIAQTSKDKYLTIEPIQKQEDYAVSDAQRRLWVLAQIGNESAAYNMPATLIISQDYDPNLLLKAIDTLIERHEILRTTFIQKETGEIRQKIKAGKDLDFEVERIDFSKELNGGQKAETYTSADGIIPFDLENGPLIRIALIDVSTLKRLLYFNIHHIITDGWSMEIISKEIFELYAQFQKQETVQLEPLKIQYKDYAAWQLSQQDTETYQQEKKYWLSQFKNELPLFNLSASNLRPAAKTNKGRILRTAFSSEQVKQLNQFVKAQNGTLFMGLVSAVKTLFYKYTGENDFIIGSPIAGRNHADLENQIGFYANTLALRNTLNGEESFRDLFDSVKANTLKAYENQTYPFDRLVEDLDLKRDTSRNALFDVMIVLQNTIGKQKLIEEGITATEEVIEVGTSLSKFDLLFNFEEIENELVLSLEFNEDIYNLETVVGLIGHLKSLLKVLLTEPSQAIDAITYLSEGEKELLDDQFNATTKHFGELNPMQLIVEKAHETPTKTALVFDQKSYSYKYVNEQSNRFANYLIEKHKVVPGKRVGVMLNRSVESVLSMLAVLKTGASYVPIDHQYPAARIAHILRDAGIETLISEKKISEKQQLSDVNVIDIKSVDFNDVQTIAPVSMNNLNGEAFVIYTSGSTGLPKGVIQTYEMLNNLVHWEGGMSGVNRKSKYLQYVSFSFDVSLQDCLSVLAHGGELHIAKEEIRLNFDDLKTYIIAEQIETLCFPYSALSNFYTALGGDWIERHSIKQVICSGEQLQLNRAMQLFFKKNPSVELHNHYGPSESHVVTSHIMSFEKGTLENRAPIGQPIANTSIHILDKNFNQVPIGVPGELYITGTNLAQGYINLPKQTQERFIILPIDKPEKAYATGDLAKWRKDGVIEYLGRRDNQIKIRGYRIELGEIEENILTHPAIEAVVLTVFENKGENNLCAYLLAENKLSVELMRTFLSKQLPAYMIPSHFVQLECFPLTSNGKVDKRALPSPENNGLTSSVEYVAPESDTELKIAAIWQDLLGQEQIGLKNDFFELGGHSLKAMRLISEYHKVFNVKLALKDLFSQTKLEEHAALLSAGIESDFIDITAVEIADYYPCSPSQQRLWLVDQLNPGTTDYNMFGTYNLPADFNAFYFEQAVNELITRHEVLRTVFIAEDGVPYQRVIPASEIHLEIPAGSSADYPQESIAFHSFDLKEWALLKLVLITDEANPKLLFCMHHIISDGWSMELFIRDTFALYESLISNTIAELPVLPIQYKDYAVWQNQQVSSAQGEKDRTFWMKALSGNLPQNRLPEDYSTARPGMDGNTFEYFISEELKAKIDTFLLQEKASLFALFISSFNILVNRLTGEDDLIVGTPVANREHEAVKDLIGFFLNTLMLRNKLDKNQNVSTYLNQVNTNLIESLAHQSYPFENLLDDLEVPRDYNRFPISSLFLNMIDFNSTDKSTIENFEPKHENDSGAAKFDLECYFKSYENSISIYCIYKNKRFKAESIELWMRELVNIIDQTIAKPTATINEVSLFKTETKKAVYPIPNVDFTPFKTEEKTATIISRFEEQVVKYGNRPAIITAGQSQNYKELNAYSNGIAALIQNEDGQKTSTAPIALLVEHSALTMSSMLGVLKSGNSYVPLDSDYPKERLEYMLEDTACTILLATKQTEALAKTLKENKQNLNIIILDDNIKPIEENPKNTLKPDSPAYILYTSGSTGKPKGVIQSHKNVLHFMSVYTNNLHINSEDKLSLLPTYSFDASVMDFYGGLLNGACLYPYHVKTAGIDVLGDWIVNNEITILHMVPTLYRYFLEGREEKESEKKQLENIRLVVLGGEAVFQADHTAFKKHFSAGSILINGYGPTESTITMQKFMDHETDVNKTQVGIGYPVVNTTVYLLNEQDEQVGIYQEGELVYKSDYLALAYHNQPEQTAKAFTVDPITGTGKVYRSGDIGRLLPNGEIEFTGRKDGQVKLNGQRIELAEIEQELLKITAVEETIVQLKNAGETDKLVAYIKGEAKEVEIKQALSMALPLYMVPAVYVYLTEFPLTPTGKISRRDLPEPDLTIATVEYVAPRNEVETSIIEIIATVLELEIELIGVENNFFDLGGNSIKLFKILNLINQKLDKELKIISLFHYPTVSSLVDHITVGEQMNESENQFEEADLFSDDFSEELDEMIDFMED